MTGIPIRIMRDGKPVNVDFDEMTEKEMRDFLATKSHVWVLNLAVILGGWIRENVSEASSGRD